MSAPKLKSTGVIPLAGGVQEYGDPVLIPKHRKVNMEDCHIDEEGYLVKRPGRRLTTPDFRIWE